MSLAIDWFGVKKAEDPMLYLDDVFRYASVRLGQREDAEDIAIEVVQALPNPCSKSNLKAYMIGMARRKIADRLRRSRPTQTSRESDGQVRFEHKVEEAALVGFAMKQISAEHREVLALKYIVGLSSAEVGKILGKRPDAVDSLLQRARGAFELVWVGLTSEEVKL